MVVDGLSGALAEVFQKLSKRYLVTVVRIDEGKP